MTPQDIRWKQRFSNFKKALRQFEDGVMSNTQDRMAQEGLIQRFEFTFELGWKCLQDILIERGYDFARGPKPTIQQAFQDGLITDGIVWMSMLKARNEASHLYDEEVFHDIHQKAKNEFLKPLRDLCQTLELL